MTADDARLIYRHAVAWTASHGTQVCAIRLDVVTVCVDGASHAIDYRQSGVMVMFLTLLPIALALFVGSGV